LQFFKVQSLQIQTVLSLLPSVIAGSLLSLTDGWGAQGAASVLHTTQTWCTWTRQCPTTDECPSLRWRKILLSAKI